MRKFLTTSASATFFGNSENVSTKVVRIIQSYVGVVNKMVWRKF